MIHVHISKRKQLDETVDMEFLSFIFRSVVHEAEKANHHKDVTRGTSTMQLLAGHGLKGRGY